MRRHLDPLEARRFLNAGELDTTFGDAGHVELAPAQASAVLPLDLDVDSTGHAIVTAETLAADRVVQDPEGYDLHLWRLRPDGSRDTHFGASGDGLLTLHVPPSVFDTRNHPIVPPRT